MRALPPPLTQAPSPQSFWQDFRLLLATQVRVKLNKMRQRPLGVWLLILIPSLAFLFLLIFLGKLAFGAVSSISPDIGQGFLSLIFMIGLSGQIFFGLTAAFTTLYMSEDLELLFVAPVSTRAVFAVKTLVIAGSNLLVASFFILLPGVFFGLLFGVSASYYIWLALIALGLVALGTALAELLNMVVMRLVPSHRSKEAVGFIGALAGILIALVFQIPSIMMSSGANVEGWLTQQQQMLDTFAYFPWGWGAQALSDAAAAQYLSALGWTLLVLAAGVAAFALAFTLVERGFRRGWVSLSQGGGRRRKKVSPVSAPSPSRGQVLTPVEMEAASPRWGMWWVAKKDLLYMKRDAREWFGYITPLLFMLFFIVRAIFFPGPGAMQALFMVLIMYTIMFSGNMALQSFGREGESNWVLNSVPLAGWPVVLGKLIAAVLPTLVLMVAMLIGTGIAIDLPASLLLALALGAILISLGSSAIGLFYSVNHSRYNPDTPQQRISGGAVILMYFVNFLFIGLLAICLLYAFPPEGLANLVQSITPPPLDWSWASVIGNLLYLLVTPLTWAPAVRITFGLVATLSVWTAIFYSFMAATVKQARKGFRVELVTNIHKNKQKKVD